MLTPSLAPRPPPRFYLATKRSGRRPGNEARQHPPLQTPPILSTLLCIVEWRGHTKHWAHQTLSSLNASLKLGGKDEKPGKKRKKKKRIGNNNNTKRKRKKNKRKKKKNERKKKEEKKKKKKRKKKKTKERKEKERKTKEEEEKKTTYSLPSLRERSETPGALDRRALGITGGEPVAQPPSFRLRSALPVTGVPTVGGVVKNRSICVRGGPNPDSIIGEANVQNPSLQPNTPPRLPAKTGFKFNI